MEERNVKIVRDPVKKSTKSIIFDILKDLCMVIFHKNTRWNFIYA